MFNWYKRTIELTGIKLYQIIPYLCAMVFAKQCIFMMLDPQTHVHEAVKLGSVLDGELHPHRRLVFVDAVMFGDAAVRQAQGVTLLVAATLTDTGGGG